jgi:hypothetical protein
VAHPRADNERVVAVRPCKYPPVFFLDYRIAKRPRDDQDPEAARRVAHRVGLVR